MWGAKNAKKYIWKIDSKINPVIPDNLQMYVFGALSTDCIRDKQHYSYEECIFDSGVSCPLRPLHFALLKIFFFFILSTS